jgi:ABC-type amino acid transport substrate-binding protein
MIASGRAELECANTTQTQSRLANVDFSNLIFVDSGGFLVIAGSPINGIADLGGKRVGVLKGTTTEARLNDALRRRLINASVVAIEDAGAGVTMLESGKLDAYAGDKIKLVGLAVQAKEPAKLVAAFGGSIVRAVRAGIAAQRLVAPARSEQGVDASLHGRRDRADIREMAGQAWAAFGPAGRHVPAERNS